MDLYVKSERYARRSDANAIALAIATRIHPERTMNLRDNIY